MVKGWWWIRKPEELTAILTALHPRGIRERVLLKNLTKHMEFLTECCTQPMAGESILRSQYYVDICCYTNMEKLVYKCYRSFAETMNILNIYLNVFFVYGNLVQIMCSPYKVGI